MKDEKAPEGYVKKEPIVQLIEVVQRQQKLLAGVADMVIGISREEYVKNMMALEKCRFPPIEKANEDLLEKMAQLLVDKALMEQPEMRKEDPKAMLDDAKLALEQTIHRYVKP
jgi:hypothetical protein